MNYTQPVTFSVTNQYGNDRPGEDDVYTVAEFKTLCSAGGFIDYDGYGHPVKNKLADPGVYIKPSRLQDIADDATHIVWYNR